MSLDDLEAKAKAATPGPWHSRHYPDCASLVKMPSDEIQDITRPEDADFIAALNPTVALALIAVAKAATRLRSDGLYYDADIVTALEALARALEGMK